MEVKVETLLLTFTANQIPREKPECPWTEEGNGEKTQFQILKQNQTLGSKNIPSALLLFFLVSPKFLTPLKPQITIWKSEFMIQRQKWIFFKFLLKPPPFFSPLSLLNFSLVYS